MDNKIMGYVDISLMLHHLENFGKQNSSSWEYWLQMGATYQAINWMQDKEKKKKYIKKLDEINEKYSKY